MHRLTALLLMGVLLTGCASKGPLLPTTSALQVRQFQTRSFETPDEKLVMRAVLQGLQDAGFQLRQAEAELGMVVATRETFEKGTPKALRIASLLAFYTAPLYFLTKGSTRTLVEITGTVVKVGGQTRVRLTGQLKRLDSKGSIKDLRWLDDGAFYQDIFARIDKAVFLEQEKL